MHKTTTNPAPSSDHPAERYQEWIKTHVFQRTDGADFERRMQEWRSPPRFHIAVVLDTESAIALGASLQSLANQYYPHLRVTVSAPLPPPGNLPPDRLQWINSASTWQDANQALLASAPETWVGLLRAGDTLAPHALLVLAEYLHTNPHLQAVYTDEDIIEADGARHSPRFKPDFDLELLRSANYVGGLVLARQPSWTAAGGWQHFPSYSDELDLALRLSEVLAHTSIGHGADLLYHRHSDHPALQMHPNNQLEKLQCLDNHLQRTSPNARAIPGDTPGTFHVLYPLSATPRVSIIIPTRDQFGLLERCIDSLFNLTDYADYEVLIIDNGSQEKAARAYLDGLRQLGDSRIRVLSYDPPFNFSAMNNLAAREATGQLLLLLNNDTAVLHRDWLTEMVSLALQPQVGIVGARLLYPDGNIQHAGVTLGMAGPAEHPFIGWPHDKPSPMQRSHAVQQYSAVTAACALIHRDLYLSLGGMDEASFSVSYNDIDLCLKVREQGLRILWSPHATLLHEGSATQQQNKKNAPSRPDKLTRFAAEQNAMYERWMPKLIRDPAYNPNLSLSSRDMTPEPEAALSWNPTPWNPRPRILVHPVNQDGSGQYRLLGPVRGLNDTARCRGHASQRLFNPVEIAKANMDSIVVQIPTSARHLKAMEIYRQYSGAFCIAEADDLITEIPRASPLYHVIGKEARDHFRKSLRIADRLVVTTEPLALAFADYCQEVRVARNYLPGQLWNHLTPTRRPNGKPRVGWAGSMSHLGDLALLDEIVKTLAKEVDWVFFGACRRDLLPYVKETFNGVPFDQYPGTLASMGLDLALAPLENNAFNECKSSLKLLEYGILGYPVVCSNSAAYRGDFPVKRVPNTAKAWIAAIRERIHDLDATRKEGETLQAHIRQHWMLEDHLDEWLTAWTR